MAQIRENAWQEMSQGSARYCWDVVHKLDEQGMPDIPVPFVPDKHNVTASDLDRAERTFEEALDFCQTYTADEWRKQYGVTNIDTVIDRLEQAIDRVQQEKGRIKQDQNQRDAKLDNDYALTVIR